MTIILACALSASAQSPAVQAHASQPHWITPLVTFTPLLEQEYRFDLDADSPGIGSGGSVDYGGGKGLELIPWARTEVVIGEPGYQASSNPGLSSGWGDLSGAIKFRLAAAPAGQGDYVATIFLTATAPTGTPGVAPPVGSLTPGIGLGKGWGPWDVQTTVGVTYYHARTADLGTPLAWNTAVQYHWGRRVWPQLEFSPTWWVSGPNAGHAEMLLTPGVVVGKIPLAGRLGLTAGVGEEIATTGEAPFRHRFIVSVRLPF
ncbi:MAG: hypothetical protein ACRD13_13205 [Terriglobales bacterium]